MNSFQSIYVYLHHASHKGPVANPNPYTGNLVFACCLTMGTMALIGTLMIVSESFYDWMDHTFLDFFRDIGERTSVFIIVFTFGTVFFLIGRLTMGSKKGYPRLLQRFYALPESEQTSIANRGQLLAAILLFSIFVPMLLGAIFGMG